MGHTSNEYRESLRIYDELTTERRALWNDFCNGKLKEGDVVAFLLHLGGAVPNMYSYEQRHFCWSESMDWGLALRDIRMEAGRASPWGTGSYVGILGEAKCRIGIMDNLIDEKLFPNPPINHEDLEKMANTVDKKNAGR